MRNRQIVKIAIKNLFLKHKVDPFPYYYQKCPYCGHLYQTVRFNLRSYMDEKDADYFIHEFYTKGIIGRCVKCGNKLLFTFDKIYSLDHEISKVAKFAEIPDKWYRYASFIKPRKEVRTMEILK